MNGQWQRIKDGTQYIGGDITGKELDKGMVEAARDEYVNTFDKHAVWKLVDIEIPGMKGLKLIATKWIDINN